MSLLRRCATVAGAAALLAVPPALMTLADAGDRPMASAHADRSNPQLRALDRRIQTVQAQKIAAQDQALPTAQDVAQNVAGTWCGTERSTDNVTQNVYAPSEKQVKVLYVHPADAPSRMTQVANEIQDYARISTDIIQTASQNTRSVRWDMGTDCSTNALDIMTVRLPQPMAYYRGSERFGRLTTDIREAVSQAGLAEGRNLLAYIDGNVAAGNVTGQAEWPNDSSKGPQNRFSTGGLAALVYGVDAEPKDKVFQGASTTLHELTHILGSVQRDAPHATQYGHCTTVGDVMCYQDGPGTVMTEQCPALIDSAYRQVYDCDGDDYFNPAPPAGSYLARSWNVYDSPYLCALPGCLPAGQPQVTPKKLPGKVTGAVRDRYIGRAKARVRFNARPSGEALINYRVYSGGKRIYPQIVASFGRRYVTLQLNARSTRTITVRAVNASGVGPVSARVVLSSQKTRAKALKQTGRR